MKADACLLRFFNSRKSIACYIACYNKLIDINLRFKLRRRYVVTFLAAHLALLTYTAELCGRDASIGAFVECMALTRRCNVSSGRLQRQNLPLS